MSRAMSVYFTWRVCFMWSWSVTLTPQGTVDSRTAAETQVSIVTLTALKHNLHALKTKTRQGGLTVEICVQLQPSISWWCESQQEGFRWVRALPEGSGRSEVAGRGRAEPASCSRANPEQSARWPHSALAGTQGGIRKASF